MFNLTKIAAIGWLQKIEHVKMKTLLDPVFLILKIVYSSEHGVERKQIEQVSISWGGVP